MWPRSGQMRRLLLATSLTLFVFSDEVPTNPRGCSSCCSGCGGSLSDSTSVCRAHAVLRKRDRKELATELGYTGDMNDSATMNIWLHKQVMKKVAENGGTVPADLLS